MQETTPMPKKISTDAMKQRDATTATVKSWLSEIESIDGIEEFSAEVSFVRAEPAWEIVKNRGKAGVMASRWPDGKRRPYRTKLVIYGHVPATIVAAVYRANLDT